MKNLNCLSREVVRFLILPVVLLSVSCSSDQSGHPSDEITTPIGVTSDLVIGLEDQPLDHQFGEPIAVRTDEEGRIYIADRARMAIKVFDRHGNYLRSLGGRGRGPGEFHDMEMVELTPEGHLVVLDRGNMRYTVISTDGEEIASFPYNLSDQFYPQSITYVDGQMLALFYRSSSSLEIPEFERDLFHIYSTDFQERKTSFLPVKRLGFDDWYQLQAMGFHPGSFTLSEDRNLLVFSPSTYTGTLYVYRKQEDGEWEFEKTLQGREPGVNPIHIYASESQYKRAMDNGLARAGQVRYAGETYWGSQLSMDAGLFAMDDGRLVHFYAEWKEGYERLSGSMSHPMDLYVQVFDPDGDLRHHGYLFPFVEQFVVPLYSVVNWMDEQGRFYLLEHPDGIPVVRRFSLDLPGLSVKMVESESEPNHADTQY